MLQNHVDIIKTFPAKSMAAADLSAALEACEKLCMSNGKCTACSADMTTAPPHEAVRWVAMSQKCILDSLKSWPGTMVGDVSMKKSSGTVNITLTGPAGAW